MEKEPFAELSAAILKDTDLQPGSIQDMEVLKRWLAARVEDLLLHQAPRLWSILYRIDVSEQKIKQAMASCTGQALYETLAQLIIDRQLQKIETRKKYR